MKDFMKIPTLDQPATYEIKVPGHINDRWAEWAEGMMIIIEGKGDEKPIVSIPVKDLKEAWKNPFGDLI